MEKKRIEMKEIRTMRYVKGLCAYCGKNKLPEDGGQMCPSCREKQKLWKRRYDKKKKEGKNG